MEKRNFKKSEIIGSEAKLPPQAIDLEQVVLGACILNQNDFLEISDFLRPEMFYKDSHQKIFKAICQMSLDGEPIELVTLVHKLTKSGDLKSVGGAFYITEICDNVVNSTNIEYNARIIAQKYMQRSLIELSTKTIIDCYDETSDVFETLDAYESKRDEIINQVISKKEISNQDAVPEFMQDLIVKSQMADKDVTGIDTGFNELNSNTGGWQDGQLLILAARPAMGKTALMLSFVISAAKAGHPVAVFSLEMPKEQLIMRCLSILSGIELSKLSKPSRLDDSDWSQLYASKDELEQLPIIWDDSANITMLEISSKCKRLKRKEGIKFVVIDYLQLINPSDKKVIREQQISQISRSLKILSKEIKAPVMALSQLSRAVELRPNKRPLLSDLRESGSIEQDADMIMFIYRAIYYGVEEDEMGKSTHGMAEIIIAKNRSGQVDTVEAGFDAQKTRFFDLNAEPNFDFSFIETSKNIEFPSNDLSKYRNNEPNFDDDISEMNNFIRNKTQNNYEDEDPF